jgi:N-acetylglucosaminyl-diphospho-decaprenol L-rhamnosyltransferase
MGGRDVTLSIVSHRQNALVNDLLADVERHCASRVTVVLTENVPDSTLLAAERLSCPVEIITNPAVKGFGANHNAAFSRCRTPFFCVANPDIRLPRDPLPTLLQDAMEPGVALAGPLVRAPAGGVEDSARRFPTIGSLLKKLFVDSGGPEYPTDRGVVTVDWVAGMLMLFRADAFRGVSGFDERFFLYYEDVDICRRLQKKGLQVRYDPRVEVIHDARRTSRRHPRYMAWHLAGILRFLLTR